MPHATFSQAEDAFLTAQRGQMTADAIGAHLGRSGDAIRRRWRNLGLTGSKPATAAQRRARQTARLSDAEMIAMHLARKGVTPCPPGIAAGVAPLEMHLGFTAQPAPSMSYRERGHQMIKASIAQRRASA